MIVKCWFVANVKKTGPTLGVKGGIYLDDLNHDEPELTALYLYSRKTYVTYRASLVKYNNNNNNNNGLTLLLLLTSSHFTRSVVEAV